jgi:hypothetical protein
MHENSRLILKAGERPRMQKESPRLLHLLHEELP